MLRLLFRRLLRLYPADVRRRDAAEMEAVFVHCVRVERGRRGRVASLVAVGGGLADTVRGAVALRRHRAPSAPRDARWRDLRQDGRYALRLLRRSPTFTAVALVTIALGVGASTAIFSVVNDVMLRRLPYANADRAVLIWNTGGPAGRAHDAVAAPEFADIREAGGAFDRVAALRFEPSNLTGGCAGPGCEAERVNAYAVSPGLFDLLGVEPRIGRPFVAADGGAAAPATVMLSDDFWRRRFLADPGVVGRSVTLGGLPRTVIGVMPPGVAFPDVPLEGFVERADVWTPYRWERARADSRGNQVLMVVARVARGLPMSRAHADLDVIANRFRAEFPDRYASPSRHWALESDTLRHEMVGDLQPDLLALLGAVGLVLLIACANVATLVLARGRAREREMAVRSALGAGRARLVRQLLVEALAVAALGGPLGVAVALAGMRALTALDPTVIPRLSGPRIDLTVLAFSAGVTMFTGLVVGLYPALRQSRIPPRAALAEDARAGGTGSVRRRLRGALVVAEVAMAAVVLVGAGLVVRSFVAMAHVDTGVDRSNVLVFEVALPRVKYTSAARILGLDRALLDRLRALPGVLQASAVYPMPMTGDRWGGSFDVEGLDVPAGQEGPHAEYAVALPGYFATLRITLRAGREFTGGDEAGAPRVVIVDDTLARRYWPGHSALGKRLNPNGNPGDWATVVGVVAHVRNGGPRDAGEPQIYLPETQHVEALLDFAVRTAGDPAPLAPAARAAVTTLDPALALAKLGSLADVAARQTAHERFSLLLFLIFGGVALTLAGVGLYGVMASLVTQRRREIGIRLALGGRPAHVLRQVLGEGLAMTVAGLAIGLACALPLARLIAGELFSIGPTDAATYAAIGALLLTVALVASSLPARRATRVNPVDVLRH